MQPSFDDAETSDPGFVNQLRSASGEQTPWLDPRGTTGNTLRGQCRPRANDRHLAVMKRETCLLLCVPAHHLSRRNLLFTTASPSRLRPLSFRRAPKFFSPRLDPAFQAEFLCFERPKGDSLPFPPTPVLFLGFP
ncbi:hypothetical protein CIHG_06031, partial [Coccidioides immitis H538.4]